MYTQSPFTSPLTEKYIEKQRLRSIANGVGLACLASLAVMSGWARFFLSIVQVFGISILSAIAVANEPAVSEFLGIIVSLLMSIVPFLILFVSIFDSTKSNISFTFSKKGLLAISVVGFSFCNLAASLNAGLVELFSIFGITFPSSTSNLSDGFFGFLLSLLSTAAIPALVEEFSMRYVSLSILRKFGGSFAIFATAIMFGFLHGNLRQMFFAFLVGAFLGFITVKTNSIWPAVIVHFINNAFNVVVSYIYKIFGVFTGNIFYYIVLVISFIAAAIVILLKKIDFFVLRESEKNRYFCFREKIKIFFSSPAIILTVIFSLYIAIFLR